MKVLFIGGTGLISVASVELAVKSGMDVHVLNRGNLSGRLSCDYNVIKGDIRDTEHMKRVLKDHSFDVVADFISFTPDQIEKNIALFMDKTQQYIFVSSASAYEKPVKDYIITEETPLRNPFWGYARDKIACEHTLMAAYGSSGFPVTIVRPSLTYGDTNLVLATNSWSKPYTLIDRIRQGKRVIIPGDGTSLWTVTHNTDFAKGFVGLMGNKSTIGEAFHITDDKVYTWAQIYYAAAKAIGAELNPVYIASETIEQHITSMKGSLTGDKMYSVVFDNSKIKRFVPGFSATTPLDEGFKRTVDWFAADKSRQIIDENWNKQLDSLISKY